MDFETIIIGAGASGLMTAAHLPRGSALLIDANRAPGAKIRISGGGKCNITNVNVDASYYAGDAVFVERVLRRFDRDALLRWLRKRGLVPVVRQSGQYFCPESAQQLLDVLAKATRKQRFALGEKVRSVTKRNGRFEVVTDKRRYVGKRVVVASGGLSYPRLGASGIGYEIAERFGHRIVRTAPALVGFTVQKEQFFFRELSGIATEASVGVGAFREEGSVLFAHKGISGPAILDASLYWEKGMIEIDFLPRFRWHNAVKSPKRISSLLPMPKRAAKAFLEHLGIEDKAFGALEREERRRLDVLRHYTFAPAGTFGYGKAEVTKGGVDTRDIDADTMMSRRIEGLYFVGEVTNVTGRLGGYNFQWAFSSAVVAAEAIVAKGDA